jgi:hypothetical protein
VADESLERVRDYAALVSAITQTHDRAQRQAAQAVNVALTLRNWLIGYYLVVRAARQRPGAIWRAAVGEAGEGSATTRWKRIHEALIGAVQALLHALLDCENTVFAIQSESDRDTRYLTPTIRLAG